MIKAVLLDLDDTLLRNPPDDFVRPYIAGIINVILRVHPEFEPSTVQQAIISGIGAIIQSRSPLHTNSDVFDATFSEATGIDSQSLDALVQQFVTTDYRKLQALTSPIDAAAPLFEWLLANNYAPAIATNPLFPAAATHQRVKWAGLRVDQPWLITVLDNTHFAKPSPAYYEEVLSRIGFETDEALMVGDDWEKDIVPAATAGLNTFYIRPGSTPDPENPTFQPDGSGTLEEFYRLITEEDWLQTLTPPPLQSRQITPRLLGNVAALHGTALDTPEHFWHQHPDPKEWSPLEVVVHLMESECDVQRPRLQQILDEADPFLTPPPEPFAPGSRDLSDIDPMETVQRFAEERQQTLDLLQNLSTDQWLRPARHSVFGPTNLLEMAAFTGRHDRLHINQLCQTIGKCQ